MTLPGIDTLQLDLAKLTDYVLNADHPEGRHKARVFRSALGITVGDAEWLADRILNGVKCADAIMQKTTAWGTIYRVDLNIERGENCARVRSAWLTSRAKTAFVTCFVIGDCDETA